MQIFDTHFITWKNVSLDEGVTRYGNSQYRSIFRKGNYACCFTDYYGWGKIARIVDLTNNHKIRLLKLELGESIKDLNYPYLLTEHQKCLRVWELMGSSKEPITTIPLKYRNFHHLTKAVIQDKTIVLLYSDLESMQPRYLTIVRDFESSSIKSKNLFDRGIDVDTDLIIDGDEIIYSVAFGNVAFLSLENPENCSSIPEIEKINSLIEQLNEENFEEYEAKIIKSFVKEGNTLVGASEKLIKIWDLISKTLIKEIPTKNEFRLISLSGRFLLGFNHNKVKIWDIFSGSVVYKEPNTSSAYIPQLTHYQDKIFRVFSRDEKLTYVIGEELSNITVEVPIVESIEEADELTDVPVNDSDDGSNSKSGFCTLI